MAIVSPATVDLNNDTIRTHVRMVVWQHRYLAMIVIFYALTCMVTANYIGSKAVTSSVIEAQAFWLVLITAVYAVAWWKPELLGRLNSGDMGNSGLPSQHLLHTLLVVLILPMFFSTFSAFKVMIPAINPYAWDVEFAAWDAALHGGTQPWRLLQPILGYPMVTVGVDVVYAIWFVIVFGALFWQSLSAKNPERRMRFLLSFVLSWIVIGTIAATCLSSAGPVYLAQLTGVESDYGELLAYLRSVDEKYPVLVVQAQDMLWNTYLSGEANLGNGISAMPSMHVAAAVLTVFLLWDSGLTARIATTLFASVIFLGSIHLAWHYALDGYAGAALTAAIWKMSPYLTRRAFAGYGAELQTQPDGIASH